MKKEILEKIKFCKEELELTISQTARYLNYSYLTIKRY